MFIIIQYKKMKELIYFKHIAVYVFEEKYPLWCNGFHL